MTTELTLLNDGMPRLSWLDIAERKSGAIRLTPAEAQPEPRNLRRIKGEVQRRWGIVPLIDMLKEAVLRTGCLDAVTSVSGGGSLSVEVLAERLLLVIYAYGTNTGIKAVASGGHGHTEDELRYVRRRYLSAEAARAIAIQIANATFAARSTELWGQGSTAVASDSTHVRAYDQNLFTEWHSRYGGRGVLIYWHVEKKSLAIHSQLINCTASEVAAMVEGAMRHGTTMDVEANYTDSHGQSEIGFGITRLLNFDLLPRIKRINKVKLYRPVVGEPDAYPQLTPALTRPIRWELITQQYDQMIKYATAIRTRTASTEAILRRFTRNASHPTYAAMLEVGRAQKTIFIARYLRLRDLFTLAEVLAEQERVLGPDHCETLVTRRDLASLRGEAGDPSGAVAALEQLLPDSERVLGPIRPLTFATRSALEKWRERSDQWSGSDRLMSKID
ncbi:Tn3 family transposase [Streptomyces sp. NPDC050658]|uniref:Tn3 family transposase n=1 Tax=unclassified Streptomyces TaxID=2593676 RepID=UPI003422369E